MSKRDLEQRKARATIDELEAKLELARAKLEGAAADAALALKREVEQIEQGVASARGRLKELADAADHAWDEVAGKVEALTKEIGERIERVMSDKR